MSCSRSRLAALAVLATIIVLLPLVPAGAEEATPGDPVTVAAIVDGPDGPVVEQHAADSPEEAQRLVAVLGARNDVVAAEVDVPVRAVQETTTPPPTPRESQWALDRLRAEEAWEVGDARGAIVAVVDTGVDDTHPDLAGAVVDGLDVFDPGTHGRVDPLEPCPVLRCRGHGTHVAGIIAAVSADEDGIAGLARGASIMPIRVLDPSGDGSSSDVARGVLHAADHGAHVVNLSLGSTQNSDLVEFAVAYATRKGAVVVAAAGNRGRYSGPMYPAADPWTVAVGATDRDDTVADFSGRGEWLDLAAPGIDIRSIRPVAFDGSEEDYSDDGTSMATPYVAATAAMVQRRLPWLAPTAVAAHLRATATDLAPTGRDPASGDGLVDPVSALTRTPAAASACAPGRVPRSTFTDAGTGVHRPSIDCVVWYGVAHGTTATTYSPAGPVTRGQMASFIARMLNRSGVRLPSAGGQRFSDVSSTNVHHDAINQLAAAGIVFGQGATYGPGQVVTRDQMASFLVRAYDHAQQQAGRSLLPATGAQFADTAGNAHEPNINKAAAAGFANGITTTQYGPRQGVRRDQMAAFVIRVMERLAR